MDGHLLTNDPRYTIQNKGELLNLVNVGLQDGGLYTCRAMTQTSKQLLYNITYQLIISSKVIITLSGMSTISMN